MSRSIASASILALTLVSASLAAEGVPSTAGWSEQVTRALEHGDTRLARLVLQDHLQQFPDDAEARRGLARLLLDLGQGAAALRELQHLAGVRGGLERSPDLQSEIGRALLMSGQFQRVIASLDPGAAGEDSALAAELRAQLGEAHLGLGEHAAARSHLHGALERDGGNTRALLGLALLASTEGDLEAARQRIRQALDADPGSALAWELEAELAQRQGDLPAAEAAYARAIALSPSPWLTRFKRATLRLTAGDLTAARDELDAIAAQHPDFPGLTLGAGWIALVEGRPAAALESLAAYRRQVPGDVQGAYLASLALLRLGRPLESGRELAHFRAARPWDSAGIVLHGEILLALGRAGDALLRVRPLLGPGATPQVLDLVWRAQVVAGDAPAARATLRRLYAAQPGHLRYGLALAESEHRAGSPGRARSLLIELIAAHPEAREPAMALVRLDLERGETQPARARALALGAAFPDQPAVWYLLHQAHAAAGDGPGARSALHKTLDLDPRHVPAALALSRLEQAAGNHGAAQDALRRSLAADGENAEVLLGLAALDLQGGMEPETVVARLNGILSERPNDLHLRLGMARFLAGPASDPTAALGLLREVSGPQGHDPRLLRARGALALSLGQSADARADFEALAERLPGSGEARWLVALATTRASPGDLSRMVEALKSALELDAAHPLARAAIASSFAAQATTEAQTLLAVRLASVAPEQPELAFELGRLAVARKDWSGALGHLTRATDQAPDEPRYLRALMVALQGSGDAAAAAERARAWMARYPQDVDTGYAMARALMTADRIPEAREALRANLTTDPNHAHSLNDLALSLVDADPRQALALARRAHAALPERPEVADTLAAALLANADPRAALEVLQSTPDATPSPTRLYRRAAALAATGSAAAALELLDSIPGADFPEHEAARALRARLEGDSAARGDHRAAAAP